MPIRAALATRNTELYGNRAFDADAIRAMRPSLQPMAWPWLAVHELARERGVQLVTADTVTDPAGAHVIAYDWTPDSERLLQHGARGSVLVSFEPPVIAWQLYVDLPRLSSRFAHTFWFRGAASRAGGTFHPLLFPQRCPQPRAEQTPWSQRRLLVMINSNKVLPRAWHLRRWFERPRETSMKRELAALRFRAVADDRYRERLRAITSLAASADFDLYGEGWQCRHPGVDPRTHERVIRVYRGPVEDKLAVLARYRFALAIENTRFGGYISEKLFDCFAAGTIPVYDGAPDVTDYVPVDAFIDARRFADWTDLERCLGNMSENEAQRQLTAGQEFLRSPAFERFCAQTFARDLLDALND